MGTIALVGRLVVRNLRHRPLPSLLLLLAITAATTVLTLSLALHGVTDQPYQQTRAATGGPDVVAQMGGQGSAPGRPGRTDQAQVAAQARALVRAPGVAGASGPYPVASAVLRVRGLAAGAEVEGRGQRAVSLEQPRLTSGSWVRPGAVVLERTFAQALGVGTGDKVTLNGRVFTVAGTAVTAAVPPYPNLCYSPGGGTCGVFDLNRAQQFAPGDIGLAWTTEPEARSLAAAAGAPLWYFLDLKLSDPARAQAFADAHGTATWAPGRPILIAWPSIAAADSLLMQDEQAVLSPGAWLAGLLALGSVAVLAGGRLTESGRRIGLLKAVGGTPALVAVVLLAENLVLALLAAATGLAAGWLAAPLITSPGAALVGAPGPPALTLPMAGEVVAVALVVALVATLGPAVRAARISTVRALADPARPPRRLAALIAISARLPVPLLIGLRLVARRPRRALLSAASVAVTVTGVVAVLAFHATADQKRFGGSNGLGNPVAGRDAQIMLVLTVVLLALAILNSMCATWATVLDTVRASALSRAFGATPRQVSAGLSAAQVIPALPGALLGVPLGIGLFAAANGAGIVSVPPLPWLAAAVLGALAAVAVLTSIPARAGARRPVAAVLQAEPG
jgi:putative ABC transport system permease protein